MNMFLKAPRINFFGVYKRKEKYLKLGKKDANPFYILVEFYRYIRFLPNG